MRFIQPELLLLELLLPLLLLVHLRARRQGHAAALRHRRLLEHLRSRSRWQRLAPLGLMLLALGAGVAATARPIIPLWLLSGERTLVLAMDASGSMSAKDVEPDRLSASKQSAKALVDALPPNVRVAVVAYADDARLVQPPTLERADAFAAIDAIRADGGTAIGEGILVALEAALPPTQPRTGADAVGASASGTARREVKPGSYRSAAIAVLTDGRNSVGRDPLEAAQLAARAGVKVYTVGFGTPEGVLQGGPESISVPVGLDAPALEAIARITDGEYFCATSGAELARVFEGLQARLGLHRQELEVTALLALLAAILSALGAGLSLAWHGRIV
jgi:Ca-activated chloride channel homolog